MFSTVVLAAGPYHGASVHYPPPMIPTETRFQGRSGMRWSLVLRFLAVHNLPSEGAKVLTLFRR